MKHLKSLLLIVFGASLGTAMSPVTLPFLNHVINDKNAPIAASGRVPHMNIHLPPSTAPTNIVLWTSTIAPQQKNQQGLPLHRHDYARVLVPSTSGTLKRHDKDGTTTDYVLTPGTPLFLSEDTPDGFHTDDNLGKDPIVVTVVQFNHPGNVTVSPLTEADVKKSLRKPTP